MSQSHHQSHPSPSLPPAGVGVGRDSSSPSYERTLGKLTALFGWAFYLYLLPLLIRPHWDNILDKCDFFGLGDRGRISGIQLVVTTTTFLITNLVYFALYSLNIPFLEKFKVNKAPWPWEGDETARLDYKKNLNTAIFLSVFNLLFIAYPISILSYPSIRDLNIPTDSHSFDSPWRMVFIIFIGNIEIVYWYCKCYYFVVVFYTVFINEYFKCPTNCDIFLIIVLVH